MSDFVKHDAGKAQMELLPVSALVAVAAVLTYGARKYQPNNWRKCPSRARYAGALLRHLFARMRGEVLDSESGLPHLAHAATNALFLLALEEEGLGADDLSEKPEAKP